MVGGGFLGVTSLKEAAGRRGKDPIRFLVIVRVDKVTNLPTNARRVFVVWQRGGKSAQTQPVEVNDGEATFNDGLQMYATLYRDKETQSFDEKTYKFSVVEADSKVKVSKVGLNLAELCGPGTREEALELDMVSRQESAPRLAMSLETRFMSASSADVDENRSMSYAPTIRTADLLGRPTQRAATVSNTGDARASTPQADGTEMKAEEEEVAVGRGGEEEDGSGQDENGVGGGTEGPSSPADETSPQPDGTGAGEGVQAAGLESAGSAGGGSVSTDAGGAAIAGAEGNEEPSDGPPELVSIAEENLDSWHGQWDVVIVYPNDASNEGNSDNNDDNGDRKPKGAVQRLAKLAESNKMKKKEKKVAKQSGLETRRRILIRRMKRVGLVVVKQLTVDKKQVMLKITALSSTFDREACRTKVILPVKETQSTMGGLTLGYRKFDPERREIFSTLDKRFYRSMDRQRLIMSILKARRARNGCQIDFEEEVKNGVFTQIYPLHTRRGQRRMYAGWLKKSCWKIAQPVFLIRDYFGEKIAFYFAYIEFYTRWLIYLAVPGLITFFLCLGADGHLDLNHLSAVVYGVYLCFWSTGFLNAWQQHQCRLAYQFNVTDFEASQDPRPKFVGESIQGKITKAGLIEYKDLPGLTDEQLRANEDYVLWDSPIKRLAKEFAGLPVIVTFVIAVLAGTFALLALKTFMVVEEKNPSGGMVASGLNAVFIVIMNVVYQKVADRLNEWENHRTEFEFENARIVKTFVFQFINSYVTLFFIAFIKGPPIPTWIEDSSEPAPPEFEGDSHILFLGIDFNIGYCNYSSCMMDLFVQLATVVIAKQLLSNVQEIGLPWFMGKVQGFRRAYNIGGLRLALNMTKKLSKRAKAGDIKTKSLLELEHAASMPYFEEQGLMASPQGTFDEYNELMIQFGYMTLFASSFPLASFFSLLNNVLEIRVDANKILYATKRPHYEGAQDIGTWIRVLEGMGIIAVMTNFAIIFFTSEAFSGFDKDRTTDEYIECARACDDEATLVADSILLYDSVKNYTTGSHMGERMGELVDCYSQCACEGLCYSTTFRLVMFVIAEHLMLLMKIVLDLAVSDVPRDVIKSQIIEELIDEFEQEDRIDDEFEGVVEDLSTPQGRRLSRKKTASMRWIDSEDASERDYYWDSESKRTSSQKFAVDDSLFV